MRTCSPAKQRLITCYRIAEARESDVPDVGSGPKWSRARLRSHWHRRLRASKVRLVDLSVGRCTANARLARFDECMYRWVNKYVLNPKTDLAHRQRRSRQAPCGRQSACAHSDCTPRIGQTPACTIVFNLNSSSLLERPDYSADLLATCSIDCAARKRKMSFPFIAEQDARLNSARRFPSRGGIARRRSCTGPAE